jgi:hypothetical protein
MIHVGLRLCTAGSGSVVETVEFYKVSKLSVGPPEPEDEEPPWRGVPPPLAVYRERGHRRLAARTFQEKCLSCIWDAGCRSR